MKELRKEFYKDVFVDVLFVSCDTHITMSSVKFVEIRDDENFNIIRYESEIFDSIINEFNFIDKKYLKSLKNIIDNEIMKNINSNNNILAIEYIDIVIDMEILKKEK